jgi:hypothetical protein
MSDLEDYEPDPYPRYEIYKLDSEAKEYLFNYISYLTADQCMQIIATLNTDCEAFDN